MDAERLVNEDVEAQFWKRVMKGTRCWLWTGSLNKSCQGQLVFKGKGYTAHRLAWMLHRGEIHEGALVAQNCGNPKCVNPEHLELTSAGDVAKKAFKFHAAREQEYYRGRSKLTEVQALAALRLKGKVTAKVLAKRYGVKPMTIYKIWMGLTWAHLKK